MVDWLLLLVVFSVAVNIYYVYKYTEHPQAALSILVSGVFFIYAIWALEHKGSKCLRLAWTMTLTALFVNAVAFSGFC